MPDLLTVYPEQLLVIRCSKIGAALRPPSESAAAISSPRHPQEVGADITPVNCDRSETQCVGLLGWATEESAR
jgi:hypothetical protein